MRVGAAQDLADGLEGDAAVVEGRPCSRRRFPGASVVATSSM
jgi:hypothetical protein